MPKISLDPKFDFLMPFDVPLQRMGSNNDGGYLVPCGCVETADAVVSLGVNDDWNFEKQWAENSQAIIHSYDDLDLAGFAPEVRQSLMEFFSGSRIFYNQRVVNKDRSFEHFYRAVKDAGWPSCDRHSEFSELPLWIQQECIDTHGVYQYLPFLHDSSCVELPEIIERTQRHRVFLKVDVEGSEYDLIDDICGHQQRIIGVAVEFHSIGGDRHGDFLQAMADLQRYYDVVHVHGNNYSRMTLCSLPDVMEITLLRKDLNASRTKKKDLYVPGLDQPNDPRKQDYEMCFQ